MSRSPVHVYTYLTLQVEQGDQAYFDEVITQTIAGNIAEAFNQTARDKGLHNVAIRMLPVSVVQLLEFVPHNSFP